MKIYIGMEQATLFKQTFKWSSRSCTHH